MRRPEPHGIVRPHPPSTHAPSTVAKRFTVRDGFHLKDRNDEKRVEIDHAIAANGIVHALPSNQTHDPVLPDHREANPAPPPLNHRASCVDTEVAMIFDLLQRPAPSFAGGDAMPTHTPTQHDPMAQSMGDVATPVNQSPPEVPAIVSRLGPSVDWLIYRQRPNATPRRKEAQLEQLITEALNAKEDQLLHPTAPSAATPRSRRSLRRQRQHDTTAVGPLEATTNGFATNGAGANTGTLLTARASSATAPARSSTSMLSTQRSRLREKSAVPLKTEKLLGRLHELRSFPAVVERVLQGERSKRQEVVVQHGENHVLKNKKLSRLIPPLQRPVHTPVFPSIVEHKQRQATQRKLLVDEHLETSLKNVVNRWQNRRMEIQQHERAHYVQSQWLLITCLSHATGTWLNQFRACKAQRDMIFRLAMIKKIQRYWKQRQFVRKNKQAVLTLPADSPIRSQFFRMPSVLKAIYVVQLGMRRWLVRKRVRENKRSVELIITSWLEFQDVKFRRLILRFRKRVREFQTRWRTWRSITDARIKLLLLVWAKVERKHKRRGGLVTHANEDVRRGDTHSPHKQQQTRTTSSELIHRHLRNGGMVLTAVSALGGSLPSDGKATPRNSPSKRAKPELTLRQTVEDDFQFAMRDFYATTTGHSPTHPRLSTSPVHHQSTSVLPHSGHHGLHAMAKNPSAATIPTLRPAAYTTDEKIPLSLKVSLLRQLLSEKRKAFQALKDRKRAEWKEKRQQLRQLDFRYNVLDELAAYQRFQAELAVFLVLRSVSEQEIVHLIQQAHQRLRVSTDSASPFSPPLHVEIPTMAVATSPPPKRSLTPNAPSTTSRKSRYDGPRRSTLMTIHPHDSMGRGPSPVE